MSRDLVGPPPALWDPVVRVSHWVIAGAVAANALFTKGGGALHVWLGWIGMAFLAIRLVWGLVGPWEARFAAFPPRPIDALSHLNRLARRRRREFRLFVMVADQSPIRRERSYWTRFLHRDAAFYLGAETIAKVTGFPVLFAQCRRPRRGHYEVEFHELAQPPHAADGHEITERYVRLAERAIRAEPHSWLWSNRRWKRQPPADQPRQQRC